mgnify:CR=1 FL=1
MAQVGIRKIASTLRLKITNDGSLKVLIREPSVFLSPESCNIQVPITNMVSGYAESSVVQFLKKLFFGSAFRAAPIIGQVFKGSARRNIALMVADFGVVGVFGTGAFITGHFIIGHSLPPSMQFVNV